MTFRFSIPHRQGTTRIVSGEQGNAVHFSNFQNVSQDWGLWLWQMILAVMTGQVTKVLFLGREVHRTWHCYRPDQGPFQESPTTWTTASKGVMSGANCQQLIKPITFCCSHFFCLSIIKAAKDFICIQRCVFFTSPNSWIRTQSIMISRKRSRMQQFRWNQGNQSKFCINTLTEISTILDLGRWLKI